MWLTYIFFGLDLALVPRRLLATGLDCDFLLPAAPKARGTLWPMPSLCSIISWGLSPAMMALQTAQPIDYLYRSVWYRKAALIWTRPARAPEPRAFVAKQACIIVVAIFSFEQMFIWDFESVVLSYGMYCAGSTETSAYVRTGKYDVTFVKTFLSTDIFRLVFWACFVWV
jgi:hypothetical protein